MYVLRILLYCTLSVKQIVCFFAWNLFDLSFLFIRAIKLITDKIPGFWSQVEPTTEFRPVSGRKSSYSTKNKEKLLTLLLMGVGGKFAPIYINENNIKVIIQFLGLFAKKTLPLLNTPLSMSKNFCPFLNILRNWDKISWTS